jgi:hypothetical protein
VDDDLNICEAVAMKLSREIYEGKALSISVELLSISMPLMPMNKYGSLKVIFNLSGIYRS